MSLSLRSNKGVALLMTMGFTAMAVSFAIGMSRSTRASLSASGVAADRSQRIQMAISGVHAAMAILIEDQSESEIDHLGEDWSNQNRLKEIASAMAFPDGRVVISISDEMGRFPINALIRYPEGIEFSEAHRAALTNLIEQIAEKKNLESEVDTQDLINALKDWMDRGDNDAITGLNGAESEYYKMLDSPYNVSNGPFTYPEEILLIRHMSPRLFYGHDGTDGLADLVTIYGKMPAKPSRSDRWGRININTAPKEVIRAMLPVAFADLAEAIVEYRETVPPDELSDPRWYKNAPGCSGISIDPELISLSSSYFRVVSTAELSGLKTIAAVIIERHAKKNEGEWSCRVLSWDFPLSFATRRLHGAMVSELL